MWRHRGLSFGVSAGTRVAVGAKQMTASMKEASKKPILISGNNIDVTPALMDYVNKRLENVLDKLGADVTKVDVHLAVNKNPRVTNGHVAEVTIFASKTPVIRAAEGSENMYASIDLVSDRVSRKLRKYKERKVDQKRHRASLGAAAAEAEVAFEKEGVPAGTFVPPNRTAATDISDLEYVDMSVVKRKSFPMPPQTVEEAVLCLEYIDHDFYVFKNKDSGHINVVYKRNHGGVGLIEPEKV
ncbi:unnamed protein product [Phaeothamnion confervicola]